MKWLLDFPAIVSVLSFFLLWLSAVAGDFCRRKWGAMEGGERSDFGTVQAATLTLLGLLIGFTFSMAISRYEQRKSFEEAEANAIGTEYLRAGLLPIQDGTTVRELLKSYLEQRVLFYSTRDQGALGQISSSTAQLQDALWSSVQHHAVAQPSPLSALVASGMNDVLNSQGYTQAAWWNRIPFEAWVLLGGIAIGCNLLIGYGAHRTSFLFVILPMVVAASFFLIADIDSPRGGVIRVQPQNLISLSQSLSR